MILKKIFVPTQQTDSLGESIEILFKVRKEISEDRNVESILDFTKCSFITPTVLVGLNCMKYYFAKQNITLTHDNRGACASYLDVIHFPEGLDVGTLPNNAIDTILSYYHTKTYLPIISFPIQLKHYSILTQNQMILNREKVLSLIVEIIKKQTTLNVKLITILSYLIGELTTNMIEHSHSEQGILMAQAYTQKGYIEIAFADNGRGLTQSYLDNGKFKPKNDSEAISFALSGKSTKDSNNSRGFGISTSKEILAKGIQGRFFLWSGDSFHYHYKSKNDIIQYDQMYYNGCFYSLKIPLSIPEGFELYDYV